MTDGGSPEKPDVESLVRRYLDAEAARVDPDAVLAGVRARRRSRAPARWGAGLAVAAGLIAAATLNLRQPPLRADPLALVSGARDALRPGVDRTYRIRVAPSPRALAFHPLLSTLAESEPRLRTRSDRFRVEVNAGAERPWKCGRDETGEVWIAPSTALGLRFVAGEVPEGLDLALDLFNLDLLSILDGFAADFDVEAEPDAPRPGTTRLKGTLKTGRRHDRLRSVTVDVDDENLLVRRVVLARERLGRPVAEVEFTLEGTSDEPDDGYRLDGNVGPDARVFGPEQPLRRRLQLRRSFGSLFATGPE